MFPKNNGLLKKKARFHSNNINGEHINIPNDDGNLVTMFLAYFRGIMWTFTGNMNMAISYTIYPGWWFGTFPKIMHGL